MPNRNETTFTGNMGYADNAAPDSLRDYMGPGSEGLYPEGPNLLVPFNAAADTGDPGASQATVIDNVPGGIDGTGSVFRERGAPADGDDDMVFYIGDGAVYYSTNSAFGSATSAAWMKSIAGSSSFALGLAPPSTPTVAISTGGSATFKESSGGTKMDGTYSFKLTWRRPITNGESNPSGASDPLVVDSGMRVLFTPPSRPDTSVRYCRIYMTVANFSTLGPWFMVADYDYDNPVTPYYIDIYDSSLLGITPPIGYEQPPAGTHGFRLGGYLCIAGCYGGFGIIPSYLNNADSYNPDGVTFLNPGAPITACVGRANDGFQYVACRDSLHACILTGSPDTPILSRVLWGQDGFLGPNQMCYVESELWGMSSTRGPVRTMAGGVPDRSFAQPVIRTLEQMGSSAVVGYDPATNQVVYAGMDMAIAYMRGLPGDKWSAPVDLPGDVQSKVTFGGKLYLVIDGTLWEWNAGSPVVATFQPFYRSADGHEITITDMQVRAKIDSSATLEVLEGMGGAATTYTATALSMDGTTRHSEWVKMNIARLRSYVPKVVLTGGGEIYGVTAAELIHPARA